MCGWMNAVEEKRREDKKKCVWTTMDMVIVGLLLEIDLLCWSESQLELNIVVDWSGILLNI